MTNDNKQQELSDSTDTAIAYSECYAQPFFRLKNTEIWNESNLETMKRMPDNFVDLTVTSPPYDGLRTYNGYSFPFEEIAKELYRVTKQGGVVVWVVGDATVNGSETGTSFRQALYFMDVGFNLYDTMIYATNKPPQNSGRYEPEFEYIFVLCKGKPNTFNPIKRKRKWDDKRKEKAYHRATDGTMDKKQKVNIENCNVGNIWYYETGGGLTTKDSIAFKHPAIFPEQLAEDCIYSWSTENDIIYDCFGGSGTTIKMAHKWKRKGIMSEISLEYCQIAKKRVEPYLMQECLF